jgi:hypothetical protein
MIKITVEKEDKKIKKIEVSGHSGYALEGHDIVCASVSSIVTTTVNAIISICEDSIRYQAKEGFVVIDVVKDDEITMKLLDNMLQLLTELEQTYKKYIQVK